MSEQNAEMVAGRQTDVAVHQKLFDWVAPADLVWETDRRLLDIPHYSTSIADAWMIAEKLNADHVKIAVQNRIGKWGCWLGSKVGTPDEYTLLEYGETAPEAICRAALALVGGKQ